MKFTDMKVRKTTSVILGMISLVFAQCNLINPEESIPSYIRIEPFTLETEAAQGSSSEKITEGWLTVNGEFLGVYQLPAMVPVLQEGMVDIFLEAGIKDNGIGSTPDIYPFYEAYETQIELIPNQDFTINPSIGYIPDTRFSFIEDFESGSTIFQDVLLGEGEIQVNTADVFEGNFSGQIELSENDPILEIATLEAYQDLANRSPFVYLEVNYKSDVPVTFGLVGRNGANAPSTVFEPGFNPKDSWNKIYFNLSGLLATSPFDAHQIGLSAFIPVENGQLTQNNARVYLDNIKLVHF